MKHLILVKHSLPEIVESIPARDWILSEQGKTRVPILVEQLRMYQPEIVVSSVEPKAKQTAELVTDHLGLNMQVVENLHEHDRSQTIFLSHPAFEAKVQDFFNRPDELVFGSETANQAHQRFSTAVDLLRHQYGNETIVIVAHGTVISLFSSRLAGISAFPLWKELGCPSFVVLDVQSHRLVAKENILEEN